MKLIGILGGTFDPIHYGHLKIAEHVLQTTHCDRIDFIPCFKPPHRDQPCATPIQRLEMVKLAVAPFSGFYANPIEIKHQEISYTINTLRRLRTELPHDALCLIVGSDAFNQLNTWHEWEFLFDYAHIIVVTRPQSALSQTKWLMQLMKQREVTHPNALRENRAGKIYVMDIAPIDISATKIREEIKAHVNDIKTLPKTVLDYIVQNAIYQ